MDQADKKLALLDQQLNQSNAEKAIIEREVDEMMNDNEKRQELTSLTEIPQVEERENWGESDFEVGPAPVDENGEPLFYGLVKSWEDAKNDGERWMFANTARAAVDDFGNAGRDILLAHQPVKLVVNAVCTDTGVVYASSHDAAKALGLRQGNIFQVCQGRYNRVNGLHFEFAGGEMNGG